MSKKSNTLLCGFSVFFLLLSSFCLADFVAYNDCIRGDGDTTADNVTGYTIYNDYTSNTTGNLIDFATGETTSVTAAFSWNASTGLDTSETSGSADGISQPRPGTPAYDVFGGIVDFSNRLVYYGSSGWWVEIEFSGLKPNSTYSFATTAIRANDYTGRYTLFTISGYTSAVNMSSDDIYYKSGNKTILSAPGNHRDTTGYIVRWDDIQVADQGDGTGSFTVRAEAYDFYKAYPFGGFMLSEVSSNSKPNVSAGDDLVVEYPIEYITLNGSVADDGEGIPQGFLESAWSQVSGPADVEFVTGIDNEDVTVRFPEIGEYTLQLYATDGEFDSYDQVTVTIAEPSCPIGDIGGDCIVEMADMVQLAADWLDDTNAAADLNGDSIVSMIEVSLLAQSWQQNWTGSLQVNISPVDAVNAGARWRVDGGSWLSSGSIVTALPEGSHTIEYAAVTGWVAPDLETVYVTRRQEALLDAVYEVPVQTLAINEFMAVNSNLLDIRPQPETNIYTSVNGEPAYDDWIEIKNMTDDTVSLDGWYLTDNPDNLTKWQFPEGYSITGQGYFTVFASDKDSEKYGYPYIDDDGSLHTNFDLKNSGEYLALVQPDGVTIEQQFSDYPRQRGLVSYGSASDDVDNIGYLTSPTFAAANSAIYDGLVEDTKFSIDRGFYDEPFDLEITCDTVDAQIYYTIDNSEPTETNGTLYTGPITISSTTCLRAAAFKSGLLQSNIDTQTYLFLDDVLTQATGSSGSQVTPTGYPVYWVSRYNGATVAGDYQVDPDITDPDGLYGSVYADGFKDDLQAIPSISLVMPIELLFGSYGIYVDQNQDGTERAGSVEFLDPTGTEKFHTNCGIRMQGGVTDIGGTTLDRWKCYKLSFRLMFRGIFGGQLDYKLFDDSDVDTFNTIVLDSRPQNTWVHSDAVQRTHGEYVRDQVASNTQIAMGGYACHGRPVHVYLNGMYWGLYWMHERPDAAFAASYLGGEKEDYDVVKHVYNNAISGDYDDIVSLFNLSNGDGGDEVTAFENLKLKLDVPDFIDYMLVNYYIGNGDWDHKNWYASRNHYDPDGRWRWHTWDAEHIMDDGTSLAPSDVTYKNTSMAPTGLHSKWIKNDEYRMLFADRVYKHFYHDGTMAPDNFVQIFNQLTDSIDRAIVCESARWGDNRRTTPYTRNSEWLTECNRLRNSYIPSRRNVVLYQFQSSSKSPVWYPSTVAPEFYIDSVAQYGGNTPLYASLTMLDTTGTIYYTTDGTDPRLPGGAVNVASASVYSSAITLDQSVEINARAYNGGEWSPLASALFDVSPVADNLRVTEIMYNPVDTDTEYIELQNISSTETINLNRVSFTNGIDFEFGDTILYPGQFVVIVQDQTAFEARYGTGLNVAGQYTGRLDNNSEKIEFASASGTVVQSFDYKDSWYTLTDGLGFSLNIRDAFGDLTIWDEKAGWRASLYSGGTPGTAAAQALAADSIVFNEILAHSHSTYPDWIELKNNSGQDINIGGWFLSDQSGSDPNIMKYQIPADTIIESGKYALFVGDISFDNSLADGCIEPFGLSEGGETVYLFSGDSGSVTGYYQTQQKFDASETAVTFGRYEKAELSKGYDFVRLASATPGTDNDYPLIAPIVITEIYYNPDDGTDSEFVELYNRSSEPVTLMTEITVETSPGVFTVESVPWRLEGTGFEFPENVTINPYEIIIVAKEPDEYSKLSCDVYGPYDGKLDNGGEELAIQIPGDKEYGKDQYWIPVEIVDYDDSSPWPDSADGDGDSINRYDPTVYGSDYTNWYAATPTPGY